MNSSEQGAGMARRRSTRSPDEGAGMVPRLHPQTQASGEGAGVTRRSSPRLRPQIQASGEAAGMVRRRSTRLRSHIHATDEAAGTAPRLRPQTRASGEGAARVTRQIQANEDAAGVARPIRRRRGTLPEVAASLPDDDDMLREILIRLPPQPSSLPRVSAVCKRWRALVTDPKFHRQFYAHHRKPPLLGAFMVGCERTVYAPLLDPPDRIPPRRFDLGLYSGHGCRVLDCRHGRVLVRVQQKEVAVCDPISGEQRVVETPSGFRSSFSQGAVLCATAQHAHGGCHSSPFKVVLVSTYIKRPTACVYYSETGLWGSIISTEAPCQISFKPVVLVGNCLHWLAFSGDIAGELNAAERLHIG